MGQSLERVLRYHTIRGKFVGVNPELQKILGIGKVDFDFTNKELKFKSKKNLFIECCHMNDYVNAKYLLNQPVNPVNINSVSEDRKWSGKILFNYST